MSLLDVVRSAVAIADNVTKPLQATVLFRHYVGSDAYGAKTYTPDVALPATPLQAIVDWKQRQLRTQEGILSVSRASVAFLNVQALSTATNGEGVNDEDIIVLPDGTTGPILDMGGFIDAGTGHPVATEVYLG
jgi:hypothetical protein